MTTTVMVLQRQQSYDEQRSPKHFLFRLNSYNNDLKKKKLTIPFTKKSISTQTTTTTMAIISDFQSPIPALTNHFELPSSPPAGYYRVKLVRSQICNSDRRVLAGTKKGGTSQDIVLGHEGIGYIEHLSNKHIRNDLKIGDLVVLGPHFVEEDDNCLKKGLPNLSCQMKHLGIHISGVFANEMDFPEYTLNKITDSNEIIRKTNNLNDYYDQMVLIEPLACVQRGYKLLEKQDYFNIKTVENVLILGAGPMGIIHAMHIQKVYPHLKVTITDIDSTRRNLAKNITNLKATVIHNECLKDNIQYDLIVVATSCKEANIHDSIELVKHNGIILLFSGIDMKQTDSHPMISGIDIETVHRYEYSVRLMNHDMDSNGKIKKSMYFLGTSGYVKEDFETSIQELHADFMLETEFRLYKAIATSVIDKLDGKTVHDLTGIFQDITFDVPAIIPLLKLFDENEMNNCDSNVHNHLKILIRH